MGGGGGSSRASNRAAGRVSRRSAGPSAQPAVVLAEHVLTRIVLPKVPAVKVDLATFVKRSGSTLTLGGAPFKFAGATNYYMLTRAADPATRHQVAEVFETAERMGLKVIRIWAFNDGDTWNALQPRIGHIDEHVLREGLDWVIKEAKEFGIKLILTLTDSRGDYGGMPEYVRSAFGEVGTITDFYTSKVVRKAFKDYVGALVLHVSSVSHLHLRDDPTIMAWELINNPVCPGDDSGDVLQSWVEDMAGYIKGLDPHHLVMLGHSGVFGASSPHLGTYNPASLDVLQLPVPWFAAYDSTCEGADWMRNHQVEAIDVATLQLWPDDWMVAPEAWKARWTRRWLRAHITVAEQLGKPLLVSAFGKQRRGASSWMEDRNTLFQIVYEESEAAPIVAGTLFWLLASNSYPDHDGYTVYSSRVAASEAAPAWPPLSAEMADESLERRQFMNWEAMLLCGAKRAMGNSSDNRLLDDSTGGHSPWVDGWLDVLDIVNSHAQAMAKLSGVTLSKAALSHPPVSRQGRLALPEGPVLPDPTFPPDAQDSLPAVPARNGAEGVAEVQKAVLARVEGAEEGLEPRQDADVADDAEEIGEQLSPEDAEAANALQPDADEGTSVFREVKDPPVLAKVGDIASESHTQVAVESPAAGPALASVVADLTEKSAGGSVEGTADGSASGPAGGEDLSSAYDALQEAVTAEEVEGHESLADEGASVGLLGRLEGLLGPGHAADGQSENEEEVVKASLASGGGDASNQDAQESTDRIRTAEVAV